MNIVVVKPKLKRLIIPIYETKNKITVEAIKKFVISNTFPMLKELYFFIIIASKIKQFQFFNH